MQPSIGKGRKAKDFWKQGEPFVWLTGAAMALTVALTLILVTVVLWNALPVFWPSAVAEFHPLVGVYDRDGSLTTKVERLAKQAREAINARSEELGTVKELYASTWARFERQYDKEQQVEGGEVFPALREAWVLKHTVAELRGSEQLADIGATVADDGTVTLDDGTQRLDNGTIVLPDGGPRLEPDGKLLLPEGAVVASSGNFELGVLPGVEIPLISSTGPVDVARLNVTVPLLGPDRSPKQGDPGPGGEPITRIGDDGRLETTVLGEYVESTTNRQTGVTSWKYKVGNREFGPAFQWIAIHRIGEITYPEDAFVLNRAKNLDFFGFFERLETPSFDVPEEGPPIDRVKRALAKARTMFNEQVEPLKDEEQDAAKQLQNTVKYELLNAEYRLKQLKRRGEGDSDQAAAVKKKIASLRDREKELTNESDVVTRKRMQREKEVRRNVAIFRTATGAEMTIPLVDIVRPFSPNRMGFGEKVGHYIAKIWELLSTNPREANQDGGLFPAIFGTVLMVFLMAITCFPLGVLAGIYLGEYAKEGPLVKTVRIAVNNLAGIPSIVYGIFGLGFFIYICGGALDQWLYPARVDASEPVLGQACILWASLTLGLLTIPVVIVSTEEALRTIPRGIRESSYALGSTKFQTLCRVLIPMSSPGMMTGFILAMARAAGEVAPLMITGATIDAGIPLNNVFPFLHLNRQFMHLGYHVYHISCKVPNVEATKPMVYVTTLLLLAIVLTLSSVAIWLRSSMQKRYQTRGI